MEKVLFLGGVQKHTRATHKEDFFMDKKKKFDAIKLTIQDSQFQMDKNGHLYVKGLLKLFELFAVPDNQGFYICDPEDPKKIFTINRENSKKH